MPWSNSWSGGNAVVASSVQVINGQSVVASITPQGNIIGQTISSAGDILLNGSSLTATLLALPEGVIAQTTIPAAHIPSSSFGATELPLMELDVVLSANRQYQIFLSNMVVNTTGVLCRAAAFIRFTTNGTTPTVASSQLFEVWQDVESPDGLFSIIPDHSIIISVTSQTNLRMLMTSINQILTGGTQQSHTFVAAGTGIGNVGAMIQVVDLGPTIPNTGIYLGGAGGTPTAIFRSFFTLAIDSQSFTQSGAPSPGSGANNEQFMYFGQDPSFGSNGVWKSYAWFNLADTGGGNGQGGSISGLAGVAPANITYLDVWIYTAWWYAIAGGTLYIGHTPAVAQHGQEPGGGLPRELTRGYSGRGQGQWISLLGTAVQTAIQAGTFAGILLGPPPTNSVNSYGYAAGQSFGSNVPAIRAGYFK